MKPSSTTPPHDDDWIEAEIDRLEAVPCLCEECSACLGRWGGCKACDVLSVTIECERCVQLNELRLDLQQARREQHGHFGSL